ncbi:MAG: peptidyl-prolyl cis-trans isomerase [Planctomycetes bacterium]|nr:peptidyl-prolyl cis-trans isomerase [Planctomycetota bacterium]
MLPYLMLSRLLPRPLRAEARSRLFQAALASLALTGATEAVIAQQQFNSPYYGGTTPGYGGGYAQPMMPRYAPGYAQPGVVMPGQGPMNQSNPAGQPALIPPAATRPAAWPSTSPIGANAGVQAGVPPQPAYAAPGTSISSTSAPAGSQSGPPGRPVTTQPASGSGYVPPSYTLPPYQRPVAPGYAAAPAVAIPTGVSVEAATTETSPPLSPAVTQPMLVPPANTLPQPALNTQQPSASQPTTAAYPPVPQYQAAPPAQSAALMPPAQAPTRPLPPATSDAGGAGAPNGYAPAGYAPPVVAAPGAVPPLAGQPVLVANNTPLVPPNQTPPVNQAPPHAQFAPPGQPAVPNQQLPPGQPVVPGPPIATGQSAPTDQPPQVQAETFKEVKPADIVNWDGSRIVARVGNEVIQWRDVIGTVNERLSNAAGRIPQDKLDDIRMQLAKQQLEQLIQTKVICNEAKRKVAAEAIKKINEKLGEVFDEREIPRVIVRAGAKNAAEIDAKLRENGSSLDHQRRLFVDRMLAQDFVRQKVKSDEDVPLENQLAFYEQHKDEYDYKAKSRWEQITIRFDRTPNRNEAYRMIAEAGNRVLRGEPFAIVARTASQNSSARDGGAIDWTTRGSLASEAIEQAVFTLPAGQMSPILEDKQGFHIVRVIERKDAGRKPFADVQADIRKNMKKDRTDAQVDQYIADLQKQTKIWTAFDGPDRSETLPGATLLTPSNLPVPVIQPEVQQTQMPAAAAPGAYQRKY